MAGVPQGALGGGGRPFGRGSEAAKRESWLSPRCRRMLRSPPCPGWRWHPPCQVQAPEKHHQLQRQVGHEERVVALPHAVLHPGAVVVVAAHAAATLTAVPGPQGLLWAWRGEGSRPAPLRGVTRSGGWGLNLGGLPGGGRPRHGGRRSGSLHLAPPPCAHALPWRSLVTHQHQAVSAVPKGDGWRNHGRLLLLDLLLKVGDGV